jgi:phosphoribosylamine--glycine ligase
MATIGYRDGAKSWVIKADGLAGGKGVYLPEDDDQAREILEGLFSGRLHGDAGKNVVIQQRLTGPEVSVFMLIDGNRYEVIPVFAQDHKRLLAKDEGPNTGGMGAYAPVPESIVAPWQADEFYNMADKVMGGLHDQDIDFQGALFIGAMLAEQNEDKPTALEFNVRFGDPEAQVILPLLQAAGVDVYELLRRTAEGSLRNDFRWPHVGHAALTVCLAAEGYPEKPVVGDIIYGLDKDYPNVQVYHGATAKGVKPGQILTAGGRVLYVTGIGKDVDKAADFAYGAIGDEAITFPGNIVRPDIGHQARITA